MELTNRFRQEITSKLLAGLPGWAAQSRLEPEIRKQHRLEGNAKAQNPKESAVLLLVHATGDDTSLLFIKRSEYVGIHSGQIAFPGGRHEPEDKDLTHTALRETKEEVGIQVDIEAVIGKLTPLYIPPSNFNVHPYLAYLPLLPPAMPDPKEVSQVFSIRIADLLLPETLQQKTITTSDGHTIDLPCYVVNNQIIWGATSMILNEFLEIWKRP